MNDIKTLIKVTGEALTFKFSPAGAVSSARFNKLMVTQELKHLREADYKEILSLFGFQESWPEEVIQLFSKVNQDLEGLGLEIVNINETGIGKFDVFLCNKGDNQIVHKVTRGVFKYEVEKGKFVEVVKQFGMDQVICDNLLKGNYVQNQKAI